MFLVCVLFGQPAAGQGKRGQQPGGHIRIDEVFVDFNLETITIKGEDFDFGGFLEVTLGEALVGDITSLCTPDFVSIPQNITCDFSVNNGGTGLPPDGDYLLTVATGAGQSQSDEYDLTIGGRRLAGTTCPPGEALVGFDASSQIICAPFVPIPPMPIPPTKLVFVTSTGSRQIWEGSLERMISATPWRLRPVFPAPIWPGYPTGPIRRTPDSINPPTHTSARSIQPLSQTIMRISLMGRS